MPTKEVCILDIPRDKLTPGMQQYQDAKKQHPDCIILLRMGDFYELFYEDAITASKELEITLTSRGKGEKQAPLAGIPYHALDNYLGRLVKRGYKVAIVEQLEDPKKAKGLVKRGVVRIVTPGTVIESSILSEHENNYLVCISTKANSVNLAACDMSTGEFFTTSYNTVESLLHEIVKLKPAECVIPESLAVNQELISQIKQQGCFVTTLNDKYFSQENATNLLKNHFQNIESFGIQKETLTVAGALLEYLQQTQHNSLTHIITIHAKSNNHTMLLDAATFRNLELTQNIRDGSSKGTVLSVLDKTQSVLGSRLLKKWLKSPLLNVQQIQQRIQSVEEFTQNVIMREELRDLLKTMYDLERLISRVNYGTATPRDVLCLQESLAQFSKMKIILNTAKSTLLESTANIDDATKIQQLLMRALLRDVPLSTREGAIFQSEYNEELARLRSIRKNSKEYLAKLEQQEKEATGISSLKIGYTRVFGYYIEVTKKNVSLVPAHYIRKQTTANGERYITPELKEEEEKILGAQEKIHELEYNLFQELLQQVATKTKEIQTIAHHVALCDVLSSLALVATQQGYCKPEFVEENILEIHEGRHPVVEQLESHFIPNNVRLQEGEIMIITGPNMAGKSTIMRQTALIVLLAQIGSFVPATSCKLGIHDRIFSRVGAYDDLSSGQSTFMVEMSETAAILHNATVKSLLIIDEIGRGTSTFDGVSIAWSVAEYIHNHIKAKTMFATHYHVLNKLADSFSRVTNYNIAVNERSGDVVFLHKLVEGGTDASYGIHVAKLAGLPMQVVQRAKEVQTKLMNDEKMSSRMKVRKVVEQKGLGDF